MNKPMLHAVTGKNRYCGPTAMATVLGITTDHAAAVARHVSGRPSIKGLSTHHLKLALEKLGCYVIRAAFSKGTEPTVAQWLKSYSHTFKDEHVILVHGNHYGTLLGRRYLCSLTKKETVPLADIPKRRARVTGYLVIRKLPASIPDPVKVTKAPMPDAAAKRKVMALASKWKIDVERESPDATIWVYPPADLPDNLDPHSDENGGEGHYIDTWPEALERVEELIAVLQKQKGQS